MLELYYMEIAPFLEEEFRSAASRYVDGERRKKAEKCVKPEDKARSICCGLLLQLALKRHRNGGSICRSDKEIGTALTTEKTDRDILPWEKSDKDIRLADNQQSEQWNLSLEELAPIIPITYQYEKNGKPYWTDNPSDGAHMPAHFNLSHSGDYVVLALSDQEVGVDVQRKCVIKDSLAKRVLSEAEYHQYLAVLEQKGEEAAHHYFFICWTEKESVVKLTGEGLGRDFRLVTEAGSHKKYPIEEKEAPEILCYSGLLDENHFLSISHYSKNTADKADLEQKKEVLYQKKKISSVCKFIHVSFREGE